MDVLNRLAVKWSVIGILLSVIFGLFAYFVFGSEWLLEPSQGALMTVTIAIAVLGAVRDAYAAGVRSVASPSA
jgi:hypothetical protein